MTVRFTGRERVEMLCRYFLMPVKYGGLVVEPGGWLPIQQLKQAISTIGKRPVSVDYLENVLGADTLFAISDDGTKAKLTRIEEVGERYGTPDALMYATTTRAGLDAITKAKLFDGVVRPDEPSDTSDVVLVIKARRAEELGARFLRIRDEPGRLRAQSVPIECITTKRQM